ncbi:MAG: 3-hydroxyacyl-CoA dehydrogenase [Pseudomonadota bacterium]|nr:3-hydroxyacyl-CoA dehydrogenase [Pseudomonadota bacterium]
MDSNKAKIAIVGAGLIGRAWSIVFARAGHAVAVYDADADALRKSLALLEGALADLSAAGLLDEEAAVTRARIAPAATLAEAVSGAAYVQENVAEKLSLKQALFAELDRLAAPDAILASSTSTIPASQWSEKLAGRPRCLVAHPINPPHLVPLVELSPAPWTAPEVVARARALHEAAGQVPIVVNREIQGFILNRLQGALLAEAFRLYADGYASADDIDKTVRDGLGLRWSFMGPFETIDLNAPGGVVDYCERYGELYYEMAQTQLPRRWDEALVRRIERERRQRLPDSELDARSAWRDRRLMQLIAHRRRAAEQD